MPELLVESSACAQWQSLVVDAERACQRDLDETLESYLVFLLMRFAERADVASAVIAMQYLRSCESTGSERIERLRDVGDQCLLLCGLFPRRAERRLVRLSYFADLGQTAYHDLATCLRRGAATMYTQVAEGFLPLMQVMQAMRNLDVEPVRVISEDSRPSRHR